MARRVLRESSVKGLNTCYLAVQAVKVGRRPITGNASRPCGGSPAPAVRDVTRQRNSEAGTASTGAGSLTRRPEHEDSALVDGPGLLAPVQAHRRASGRQPKALPLLDEVRPCRLTRHMH